MTDKTPSMGDTLELDCPCSESDFRLNWFYKSDTDAEFALVSRGGLNERNYTFVVRNASVGGVYQCACSPAESCPVGECTECFNVSVKPTISSFTVHPPVARVGVSITLMCNATGYPDPVFQDFHLTKASPPWPETLPTLQKTNSGVTVTIKATLNHNGIFICSVHNAIGQAVEDALVTVYEPPVIVSVVNFTVSDYTMQSTAAITCQVKNDSTAADVRWTRNGRRLEEGPQFQLDNYLEAENRILSVLIVKNLSRQYIGKYQCIAVSQFNDTDDVRSVWILENTTESVVTPSIPSAPRPPSADSRGIHPGVIAAVVVIVVFLILAAIVILAVAVIGGSRLYRQRYRDRMRHNPNPTSSETVACESGNHPTTTSPPSGPDTERDNTLSFTESTETCSSIGNESDLMSLNDQNSQCGSSSVNSLTSISLDVKQKELMELLRRRNLSSSKNATI